MPLHPDFPTNPYTILDPSIRWYPGEAQLGEMGHEKLIAPLVHKIRQGVKDWRAAGYPDVSETTRALLVHWFETEHVIVTANGTKPFRWYFAQREAVESAIWLYEHEGARDAQALMRYDSNGSVSRNMFLTHWPHYVMKLATGAGKTKVMSLLMTWSYFHAFYEKDSPLSTNILLIAPNIIVLDRLRSDFEGNRIFYEDPLLPENGYEGRDWQADFQMTVHIQDEIGTVAKTGNLFLTNIHRVSDAPAPPSYEDENTTDYFLGPKPVTKTTDNLVDLGVIVRQVDDLVIFNDEAHHIHEQNAWYKNIEDIVLKMRQTDRRFGGQFDVTATPKHNNASIFVNTISDYPLVEAIRQRVVKKPVLPDEVSRAKLREEQSTDFVERYRDHIDLGVVEWRKYQTEMDKAGRKAVLFIMTDETKNCDLVADYLSRTYPDLSEQVLVIHTNKSGEISESVSGKSKEELDKLRQASREIDSGESPYKAVVSVMMLREGWDVQSVCVIVGLRAYNSQAKILPEQTLGRGLRRMFRGDDTLVETVSVIGTEAFIDFVNGIKSEGVELDEVPMGGQSPGAGPLVVEVDSDNPKKNIAALDIVLPVLAKRIEREYKNLDDIDIETLTNWRVPLKSFSTEEQRHIVFKHIDTDEISHVTELSNIGPASAENVIGWFARTIKRDLRLVGGFDVLFGKIKYFVETRLFETPVSLDDQNVLRNLSEPATSEVLFKTLKGAINDLTIVDRGTSRIENSIKLSNTRAHVKPRGDYVQSDKSIFNRVVGDNKLENDFAAFLERAADIVSYVKNDTHTGFFVEYASPRGSIANYYPDFIAKAQDGAIWIIETKGQEDIDVEPKWQRLLSWCDDATALDGNGVIYRALFVDQATWERHAGQIKSFGEATSVFDRA
ncbi:MAG: DEAD/DEAH box helicase family protein [Alphaproteobacteria bacterium]